MVISLVIRLPLGPAIPLNPCGYWIARGAGCRGRMLFRLVPAPPWQRAAAASAAATSGDQTQRKAVGRGRVTEAAFSLATDASQNQPRLSGPPCLFPIGSLILEQEPFPRKASRASVKIDVLKCDSVRAELGRQNPNSFSRAMRMLQVDETIAFKFVCFLV